MWGFSGGSVVKNLPANVGDARDMGLIPGLGQFSGVGDATHSISAQKISWTQEPGRLEFMDQSQTRLSVCVHTHPDTYSHIFVLVATDCYFLCHIILIIF